MLEFIEFPRIRRLSREIIVTEKIDGTNAQIAIWEDGEFRVGSRTRWIQPENDNHGFAKWAMQNKDELMKLGPGRHYGEWWGHGIQRGYDLFECRFSLFNTSRWADGPDCIRPKCCHVVPILYQGPFDTQKIDEVLDALEQDGSLAAPGYMNPEGIVVFHVAANICFKKTLGGDGHKGAVC
jgi:hypothetical protein